jgi:hypothetical protein
LKPLVNAKMENHTIPHPTGAGEQMGNKGLNRSFGRGISLGHLSTCTALVARLSNFPIKAMTRALTLSRFGGLQGRFVDLGGGKGEFHPHKLVGASHVKQKGTACR